MPEPLGGPALFGMVRRDDLLRLADDRARAEAARRRLDEYDTVDLIDEAKAIIDDFFDAVTWEKVENNVIKSRDALRIWRHRTLEDQENDWRHMGFSRFELQHAAERYLNRPWLHCREIDWLVVNVLLYAEYQATLDFLRIQMMPLSRYIAGQLGTRSAGAWSVALRGVVTAVKWTIWTGVAVVVTAVAGLVGPIALVAVTAA